MVAVRGQWNADFAKAMVQPAIYAWLTSIGSFLILRTDDYFIALLQDVSSIPAYRATYQFVSTLFMIVAHIAGSYSVFISQMWQAGELEAIHKIVIRNAKITLCVMGYGVAFILTAGREFLALWLGPDNFVGYPILVVFCIMLTLEAQHNVMAQSARATEDERYAPWAIASGILNVIFTWILIRPFGLLGVALGTMLAQLFTNNWYAVYRPIVRFKIPIQSYFRIVGISFFANLISSWATGAFLQLILIKKIFVFSSKLNSILIALISCTLVGLLFMWREVLEPQERLKLMQKVGRMPKLNIFN